MEIPNNLSSLLHIVGDGLIRIGDLDGVHPSFKGYNDGLVGGRRRAGGEVVQKVVGIHGCGRDDYTEFWAFATDSGSRPSG